jgi:ribosomal protein L22
MVSPLQKAQVLTQRRKAAKIPKLKKVHVLTQRRKAAKMFKKVFDHLENDAVIPSFFSHTL